MFTFSLYWLYFSVKNQQIFFALKNFKQIFKTLNPRIKTKFKFSWILDKKKFNGPIMCFYSDFRMNFVFDIINRTDHFAQLKNNKMLKLSEVSLIELYTPDYICLKLGPFTKYAYLVNPAWKKIDGFVKHYCRNPEAESYSDLMDRFISNLVKRNWSDLKRIPLLSIPQIDFLYSERGLLEDVVDHIEINSPYELRLFDKNGQCIKTIPYFDS